MEDREYRRRARRSESQWEISSEGYESINPEPRPIGWRTLVFVIAGAIIAAAASYYLYVAAQNAMAGVGLNLPIDQIYAQRCGSCHSAPPPEKFAQWGPRDWERNVERTMFMPGEKEEVHHYLDRVSKEAPGAASS